MPKAAKRITRATIDSLLRQAKAEPGFENWAADADQKGLAIWTRKSCLNYYFHYRSPTSGKRRRERLERVGDITLEQARLAAQERLGQVVRGVDPREEKERRQRESVTLQKAVGAYLEELKLRAKASSYASAESRLQRHWLPRLGPERLKDITVEKVSRIHRELADHKPEANRAVATLSAVFGHGLRCGWVTENPVSKVRPYKENGRREPLSEGQLRNLGQVIADQEDDLHPSVPLILRFIAMTGFRRGELLGPASKRRRNSKDEFMTWGEVDFETGVISLRHTKTGAQRRVIGEPALDLLREARPENAHPRDPVFPGINSGRPYIGIDIPRSKLYKAAKIEGRDLHSMRHSFASIGASLQDGRYNGLISSLLGHQATRLSITSRYISSNPVALKKAADAVSGHIATLLGIGQEGEVVKFPTKVISR